MSMICAAFDRLANLWASIRGYFNADLIQYIQLDHIWSIPLSERTYDFVLTQYESEIRSNLAIETFTDMSVGRGGFGQVFAALENNSDSGDDGYIKCALKVQSSFYLDKNKRSDWYVRAQDEVKFLKAVQNHPNVIKYLDHLFLNEPTVDKPNIATHLVIKTEYMKMSLKNLLRLHVNKLSFKESVHLAKQLATTVEFIHSKYICHHDLNSNNLLINYEPNQPDKEAQLMSLPFKVIDFGLAKQYESRSTEDILESLFFRGTESFKPREKCTKVPYNPYISDSYSLGATLAQAIMGIDEQNRFTEKPINYYYDQFVLYTRKLVSEGSVDQEQIDFYELILQLLSPNPKMRLSVGEFARRIAHL